SIRLNPVNCLVFLSPRSTFVNHLNPTTSHRTTYSPHNPTSNLRRPVFVADTVCSAALDYNSTISSNARKSVKNFRPMLRGQPGKPTEGLTSEAKGRRQ
ncbi:MAG TPA: hypothetical protein PLL72_15110, partial [Burkholderiaceae bacterium]|nr:hypothetical protein [Burkholderiaceae bacterium]